MNFHFLTESADSGEIENSLVIAANKKEQSTGALEVCPRPRALN